MGLGHTEIQLSPLWRRSFYTKLIRETLERNYLTEKSSSLKYSLLTDVSMQLAVCLRQVPHE